MGWYHKYYTQEQAVNDRPLNPLYSFKCQYCGAPLNRKSFAQKYCDREDDISCWYERIKDSLNTHSWLNFSFGVKFKEIPEFVRIVLSYDGYLRDLKSCFPKNWESKIHPKLKKEIKIYLESIKIMKDKVLTFFDFWKEFNGVEFSMFNETSMHKATAEHIRIAQKYHDFVSQDFKPEMIVEYFEGVKKSEYTDYIKTTTYYISNATIEIDEFHFYQIENIEYENGLKNESVIPSYPKTLNDFISDCQRVGIELQWSEKARKELGI